MDSLSEPLISNPRKENDLESDFNYGNNVMSASADIRKGFLRKVYGILTVQLLMTTGVSGNVDSFYIFLSKLQLYVLPPSQQKFFYRTIQQLSNYRVFLVSSYCLP